MSKEILPDHFHAEMIDSLPKKRSINLYGHPTSLTMEPYFWKQLNQIAIEKETSVQKIIEAIDQLQPRNLSAALRVYVLLEKSKS
ncbi:MAG: aryl-sulfate sulfotransferase [Verrucomicrobiales bacterium]|nr:aryl-sulfate sulfotransferase [Verrucomicrobiales bacterium]|tara:strand:- start:5901 stop:6155 length:255 start_codon:yes stop_codon:yes gene_type:complete